MKEPGYFLQFLLILAWWLGLSLSNEAFDAFKSPKLDAFTFWSFFLPDVAIIAALSLVQSFRPRRPFPFIILGGFAYATLFCVSVTAFSMTGFLATTAMLLGLGYNLFLCFPQVHFRNARTSNSCVLAARTSLQVALCWGLFLYAIPLVIVTSFGGSILPPLSQRLWIGLPLLVGFSLLGVSSAIVMVHDGRGTPLPLDQTNCLVVRGPYRLVRNPMAIAGIGQGVAVGIIYGSWWVVGYALLGAIVWHVAVRPIEEADLENRFGRMYIEYRCGVGCWTPFRFRTPVWSVAFRAEETSLSN